jgi:hypothetical protein
LIEQAVAKKSRRAFTPDRKRTNEKRSRKKAQSAKNPLHAAARGFKSLLPLNFVFLVCFVARLLN